MLKMRISHKRARITPSVPAKHGAPETRIALSPTKINSHFKASKPSAAADAKPAKSEIPQTPRHRDTPKKVFVTPRHRVNLVNKHTLPQTPQTPSTPRNTIPTVYNNARQIFARSSESAGLIGRDTERKELHDFVTKRVKAVSAGCLYISGPPGTGKSALAHEVCREFEGQDAIKSLYINCMSIKSAKDVYGKLLESFSNDLDDIEDCNLDSLKELFQEREAAYLVTLDEIDHLLDVDLEMMYKLFEWAMRRDSSLILIGIANALDFTDRFLPRLKSRGLKPRLLPFMPYSAAQVSTVLTSKLKALSQASSTTPDFVPFIHPAAIQLLSKKVAAQGGDLRKAFDLCRRAIDLIEAETKDAHQKKATVPTPSPSPSKTPLMENMNLSSPASPKAVRQNALVASLKGLTLETAPRATIAHMARITSSVFNNGTASRLQTLNLQQKAVLCALSALERKKREMLTSTNVQATPSKKSNIAPTVKQLYEVYSGLCKKENLLHPLKSTEFRDVIGSLETQSLISAIEGKNGSFDPVTPSKRGRGAGFGGSLVEERRVASCFGERELMASLDGPGSGILKSMLEGN